MYRSTIHGTDEIDGIASTDGTDGITGTDGTALDIPTDGTAGTDGTTGSTEDSTMAGADTATLVQVDHLPTTMLSTMPMHIARQHHMVEAET